MREPLSLAIFSAETFSRAEGRLWTTPMMSVSIRMFADNFDRITLVGIESKAKPDPDIHIPLPEKYSLVTIREGSGLSSERLLQLTDSWSVAQNLIGKFDAYWVRLYNYPSYPAALQLVRSGLKNWFLNLHGDQEEALRIKYESSNPFTREISSTTMKMFTSYLANKAPLLFTAGPMLASKYAPRRSDYETFVDVGLKKEDIFDGRTDTFVKTPYKLVFVGELSRRKGVDVLVKSLPHIIKKGLDVTLEIYGPLNRDWLIKLANDLGVLDRINFHSYNRYGTEHFNEIKKGDCLILPSRGCEGWSRAILEANAQGLPVIVSNVNSMPIAVREWPCGIAVVPERPDKIADAVEFLATQPDERRKMIKSSLERAHHYTYEREFRRIRRKLQDLYEDRLVPLDKIDLEEAGYIPFQHGKSTKT